MLAKCTPDQEFHHYKKGLMVQTNIVNNNNMRMAKSGRCLNFLLEEASPVIAMFSFG